MADPTCRFCDTPLTETFADLGRTPPSNAFVPPGGSSVAERNFPLHAYVCSACRLVQLEAFEPPENIFSDYLYFSSFSESWLRHAEAYANAMVARFALDAGSRVVEIASNDGYLLQYFQARGVPVLGVEPAANVAAVARDKGVPTHCAFFGQATAQHLAATHGAADLIAANNVLAHVPDLNDFVAGLKTLLAPRGVLTIELPHLLQLIAQNQFDTIYHEHFSYFSMLVAERVLTKHGLALFDVTELPTHGGSLRLFASHPGAHEIQPTVADMRTRERAAGLDEAAVYAGFAERVAATRLTIQAFFAGAARDGKTVAGYGAPAKGNTLLNFCSIGPDMLPFTVDRSPHKQGMLLPGSRIPVRHPDAILAERPDYVFVLPWNLRQEISEQMAEIRDWGGRFVVPIPEIEIF